MTMLRSIMTHASVFGNLLDLRAFKAELPVSRDLGEEAWSLEPEPFLLETSNPERRVS
jgi:hypothetical protein